jgi:hypothetical protein
LFVPDTTLVGRSNRDKEVLILMEVEEDGINEDVTYEESTSLLPHHALGENGWCVFRAKLNPWSRS